MKKTNTPSWIKVGNKILIAKFDPFRSNTPSEVLKSATEETAKKIGKPKPCKYCGGNCPYDPDNSCDGYQGDIDGLYKK